MRTNSMGPPHKPDTAACVGRGGAAERVNFRVRTEMNDAKLAPTMGSLFDGIGGFPLAAIHNGIVPVWASEIEAFPIEVTRLRFPDMVHVGDITKLDGAELPPVDIICGGSPCQDLSVAGNRAGLSGARSGLFMEQVRLVKEMRNAERLRNRTALYIRPRFMVWENVPGALGAQPGMKQQTFIAEGVVAKGNGDCFLTPERHTSLSAGGGQAGQGYPCVLTAGFSAGAGASAGGIGYGEELAPTLKGSAGGNCMPSVLCLNDQGGSVMECSENVTGTLRAQEHGHQPLVYENHGIDSRYTGPHRVAPTMSARYGTGGNNVPLVEQEPVFCITGNAIDRQPKNGGNGIGYQQDIAYTLTATDHHAVFSRQRVDVFKDGEVVSTQSARQHKDATDLVLQGTGRPKLIRRLTPLECERLQGFPDNWTAIPGASDSARYKALGNSVAIPCVDYVLHGISLVLLAS